MTQADWVKELEEMECTGYTCNHETSETHYLVSKDFISKVESLAQQRTEKKWRERVEKIFQPFDLVIDCEPDCDPVTHARHDGSWKAHIKAEQMKADLLK